MVHSPAEPLPSSILASSKITSATKACFRDLNLGVLELQLRVACCVKFGYRMLIATQINLFPVLATPRFNF